MTPYALSWIGSFLDRVFPATQAPSIAFDPPSGIFDDDEDDDDSLRAYRDESYYWCMYGHW